MSLLPGHPSSAASTEQARLGWVGHDSGRGFLLSFLRLEPQAQAGQLTFSTPAPLAALRALEI